MLARGGLRHRVRGVSDDPSRAPATDDRYTDDELADFRRRMVAQPVHAALGATLVAAGPGTAVCRMPVDPGKDGGGGYLHGGFVSMAVEFAAWFVAIDLARRGQWPATLDLHLTILRSARIGSTLELRAALLSSTRTIAVVRVDVIERREDGSETVVGGGTVTKAYRDVRRG